MAPMRPIGSVVTIRRDLDPNKRYNHITINYKMTDWGGRCLTIRSVREDRIGGEIVYKYSLDGNHLVWTEEMFVTQKIRKHISEQNKNKILNDSQLFLNIMGGSND